MLKSFPNYPGARSVVIMEIDRIADSCGYAVPLYDYTGERSQLIAYWEQKGATALEEYRAEKNRKSIDGIDGLRSLETIEQ